MGTSPAGVTAELRATLWRRVAVETSAQVRALSKLVCERGIERLDPSEQGRARRLAHTIAGTLGVYGFESQARAASMIEGMLREFPAVVVDQAAVHALLTDIGTAFEGVHGSGAGAS